MSEKTKKWTADEAADAIAELIHEGWLEAFSPVKVMDADGNILSEDVMFVPTGALIEAGRKYCHTRH